VEAGALAGMTPDFRLDGRLAVVTGAAKGIGRTLAAALAAHGADIAALDADAAVDDVAADIAAAGRRCRTAVCDITREEQVTAVFAEIVREFGCLDVLVNNAGINLKGAALEQTRANFAPVIEVNLVGTFLCAQAAARIMVPRRSGSIINISSIAGLRALGRGNNFYAATKAAILGLTRELAVEWAPHGVRVNAIAPGWVATGRVENYLRDRPQLRQSMEAAVPLGRIGDPRDLAGPVVFLASDASSLITGQVLVVDGGVTASVALRVAES